MMFLLTTTIVLLAQQLSAFPIAGPWTSAAKTRLSATVDHKAPGFSGFSGKDFSGVTTSAPNGDYVALVQGPGGDYDGRTYSYNEGSDSDGRSSREEDFYSQEGTAYSDYYGRSGNNNNHRGYGEQDRYNREEYVQRNEYDRRETRNEDYDYPDDGQVDGAVRDSYSENRDTAGRHSEDYYDNGNDYRDDAHYDREYKDSQRYSSQHFDRDPQRHSGNYEFGYEDNHDDIVPRDSNEDYNMEKTPRPALAKRQDVSVPQQHFDSLSGEPQHSQRYASYEDDLHDFSKSQLYTQRMDRGRLTFPGKREQDRSVARVSLGRKERYVRVTPDEGKQQPQRYEDSWNQQHPLHAGLSPEHPRREPQELRPTTYFNPGQYYGGI